MRGILLVAGEVKEWRVLQPLVPIGVQPVTRCSHRHT